MMKQLILAAANKAEGSIQLPGSKSISNRILLLAGLAKGITEIHNLLISDDTTRMLEGLDTLGISLKSITDDKWHVSGCASKLPNNQAELFLGNAGTVFRPLTAVLALSNGSYHLHGTARMHERPIGDLVDALKLINADISYLKNIGFPPLQINTANINTSKPIPIRGNISSQFLTALLIALPITKNAVTIEVIGKLISKPYIEITLNLMAKFGVNVQREDWRRFYIPAQSQYISPTTIHIEGDASSASYFIAAGAIAGKVIVQGIDADSIQGDIAFTKAAEKMGAKIAFGQHQIIAYKAVQLKAIELDCNHIPDAAMTLAVMALFADGTTTLRNIASWRVKETDRIAAMATELRKVGAIVVESKDSISITPPKQLIPNAEINTYDDHRIAMCFSLVSLGGVPITINDPNCVAKTFPNYFKAFATIVS